MNSESTRALSREMLDFHRLYKERVGKRFTSHFPPLLSQAEVFLMAIITDQQRIAMSELIERTQMPKQQVTKLVNQLEEKQMVVRIRPCENRRTVILEPTSAAYALETQLLQDSETQLSHIFDELDDAALEEFLTALRTINRILDRFPTGAAQEPRKEHP